MPDDFSIDEFLDAYEQPLADVEVCMKANLVVEHASLDQQLQQALQAAGDTLADPEVSRLRREVAALEDRIAASQRTFRFQGIGHRAWQDLKRRYPPTKEQAAQGLDLNLETFVVPSIAACAARPEMSLEQANRLAGRLPEGEIQKLFGAVLRANGETTVPKSLLAAAIGRAAPNVRSSTTAALAASLAASSSVGTGDQSPSTTTTTPDA